ncbi:ExbD/TolR family protein [Merismopedia glauca]|uniref:Biopolymer transporter ExbD n=1 Tax=Merismopedia glauca CCAP 1448/3 TaxID=1296344 RepID=A0A2T1BX83_9CYAN|nr:biopolymer transporter ExbD [Merismopedia glauca]PSB00625.1 biopolymer transporter ExbD [Merismopedia glauca CCAP 1448/3]
MRFKNKYKDSHISELNLVPLMDVLLTVLTFFILISMTLTKQQGGVNIELPTTSKSAGVSKEQSPDPLIIGLNKQGEILLVNKPVTKEDLDVKIQAYLQEKPEGVVILKADRKLPYEQVLQLLASMKEIGGDRVSLAIDQK